jgi:glutamate dehydrogenase
MSVSCPPAVPFLPLTSPPEQFSNGITIISLYLNPLPNSDAPPIETSIFQVMKETSLLFSLPDNPFFLVGSGSNGHAVQEATYAYCGWIFAQHFCNRLGSAYLHLRNILDESNPAHAEVLNDIKRRFRDETFTRESIAQVIHAYPELIRLLYVNFAMTLYPSPDDASQLAYVLVTLKVFPSDQTCTDPRCRINACRRPNLSPMKNSTTNSDARSTTSTNCRSWKVS